MVANTNSVGASLAVWLASGLLAWTGASSFAELGSAIPLNGGAQAYLAYSYGPLISYLFAWTAIIALKPGEQYCCVRVQLHDVLCALQVQTLSSASFSQSISIGFSGILPALRYRQMKFLNGLSNLLQLPQYWWSQLYALLPVS